MRIFVIIATLGRPETVRQTVAQLARQTRLPDGVLLSVVSIADAGGIPPLPFPVETVLGEKGLCRQRNAALAAIDGRADIVLFLDDDFVAADDYLAALEALFAGDPGIVGATGRVIADGATGRGYDFAAAVDLVARDRPPAASRVRTIKALYGCNMAIRLAAAEGLRFDEALPLYGWLEDIDFTYRVLQRGGRLVRADTLAGVHMGTKGGRTSGLRLGYSQVANPIYMLRKRSVPKGLAWRLMRNNLFSNVGRSLCPEPHVDRLGRLRGNLIAMGDLLRGRIDPRRILELE